jgi:hypothetical protein
MCFNGKPRLPPLPKSFINSNSRNKFRKKNSPTFHSNGGTVCEEPIGNNSNDQKVAPQDSQNQHPAQQPSCATARDFAEKAIGISD